MDYKRLRHGQVILDRENPRLPEGTSTDKEAINRLLEEGYEQLLALARDMVEQGESNPTELPIVVKTGAKYLVLEGNRRFAALKLLANPRLTDDTALQASFSRLTVKGKPPAWVQCAVASSRKEADHWILLRHTGANDGVGVRRWSATQTATHRRRMKRSIDSGTLRSLAIADELVEAYQADQYLVDLIKRVRSEKLTNIGRFFAADVLTRMQFEIRQTGDEDNLSLWVRHTSEQLQPFFKWVMEYLVNQSVDEFKNHKKRGALLNKHGELIPNPSHSLQAPRRLANHPYSPPKRQEPSSSKDSGLYRPDAQSNSSIMPIERDLGVGGVGAPTKELGDRLEQPSAGRKTDKRPEKYIYSTVKVTNLSDNIQRILREAKTLPIDSNYAVACILARVIVELATSDPNVLRWSGAHDSDPLANKIKACIKKLDPNIDRSRKLTRMDLVQAWQEADGLGVPYMHQFVHNSQVKPDPHLARRFSHAFAPLLSSINESVE